MALGAVHALAQTPAQTTLPEAPTAAPAPKAKSIAIINGRPYVRPTPKDQFVDYVRDTYWWPGMARSGARALYGQIRAKPTGWGQDWPGFGQRYGSAELVTVINGNVRYGMEMLFKEDMRYIPCHGCGIGRKIGNAFLAEVTARHDSDGHRFFTVTPIVADFAGPIISNSYWYPPGHGPLDGLVATRLVVATRVGGHLFREFVMERRHKDPPIDDFSPAQRPSQPPPLKPQPKAEASQP